MTQATRPSQLPAILCLTDKCDRPESELFIGLRKAGFSVDVMCNPEGNNFQRLKDAGLVAGSIALQHRFDREGTRAIRRQLEARHYDIIHAYNPRALACALRASRGMNVKIVAYRGVIGNISYTNPESWITFLHPRVDCIVCVADAIRQYLASVRFFALRIPDKKLRTIYKGHDLAWYQATPADLTTLGVPEGAFTVCCTGRDVPRKGFDVMIESLSLLPVDAEVHLVLVGDVDTNAEIRQQVQSLAHPDRVHFTGFRPDAPAIAAASNVFVLPSKEREGLPRAVIEAMSYAVVPVVTDVGGMPELVQNGHSGIVVPPNDAQALSMAILELYQNPGKARKMGAAARQRIAGDFNTTETVEQTGALYHELVREV